MAAVAAAAAPANTASVLDTSASRLFRIRKTVCKMLEKRGYEVTVGDRDQTVEEFIETFGKQAVRSQMTLLVGLRSNPDEQLIVFFPEADLGVKECKPILEKMEELKAKRGIIVFSGRFSNLGKALFNEVAPNFLVEHFRDEELLVDITEHELVPEHVVLSDKEKAALLTRYKLSDSQLPRIQAGDPVARYFGMLRGQVVKIIRPSETAGRYVTYRIVV